MTDPCSKLLCCCCKHQNISINNKCIIYLQRNADYESKNDDNIFGCCMVTGGGVCLKNCKWL